MYSWLVTVLLLASAANDSGGQGVVGGGGLGRGECWSVFVSLQVHKCPSQATHVHNLIYQALQITDSAQSVVDFERVLSRKESVLLY